MKLTAKQRNALPDSDFGIPETRQFPIHDANHVRAAARFIKHAPKEKRKELIANINKRAKELGMKFHVGNESFFCVPANSYMTDEASNVGTLEPIVGANETNIPAGGSVPDDEDSFGSKVMDYVMKKKVVREDSVVDEGLVVGSVKFTDTSEEKLFADFVYQEILEINKQRRDAWELNTYHKGNKSLFSSFEKKISAVIADGQTKDLIKYLTYRDTKNNVANSWNYVSMNASEDIVKLLHDESLEDYNAANRIYHIICTCPEEDFTYLMATLYRACYAEHHSARFVILADMIARGKTVFKGGCGPMLLSEKDYKPNIEPNVDFTSDELNRLETYFASSATQIRNILSVLTNDSFCLDSDVPYPIAERDIMYLKYEKAITGYALLRVSGYPDKTMVFLKNVPYTDSIGILIKIREPNKGIPSLKMLYFKTGDDICKLADIATRVYGRYSRGIPADVKMKLRQMFSDVIYIMDLADNTLLKVPTTESVASIFKDAKRGVINAMRRIHVEKNGDVSINLKDELTLANYSETHRLLMADLDSDDVAGLKLNVAYVFSLITIIETKYVFGKNVDKYSSEYKDAIKLRGMLISDFNTGLNAIRKKDPSFSFIKFYKESGFESAVYRFNTSKITKLSSEKLVETIFQNAMKLKRG
jgi:hypothetical protein